MRTRLIFTFALALLAGLLASAQQETPLLRERINDVPTPATLDGVRTTPLEVPGVDDTETNVSLPDPWETD